MPSYIDCFPNDCNTDVVLYFQDNDRMDCFEFDEQGELDFPCCSCKYKKTPIAKICEGCRHYAS